MPDTEFHIHTAIWVGSLTQPGMSSFIGQLTGHERKPSRAADWRRRATEQALDAVEAILWGDSQCSDFFGGRGVLAFYRLWEQILNAKITNVAQNDKTGIEMSSKSPEFPMKYFDANGRPMKFFGIGTAFRVFGRVQIDGRGPFFSIQSRARIGGYAAGTLESRIVQILHELAHMVFKESGDNLIGDDGGSASSTSSATNTDMILDAGNGNGNCRTEIDAMERVRRGDQSQEE